MGADTTTLVIKHQHQQDADPVWIVWAVQAADNFQDEEGYRYFLQMLTLARSGDLDVGIHKWVSNKEEALAIAAQLGAECASQYGVVTVEFDQKQFDYAANIPDETDVVLQESWNDLADKITGIWDEDEEEEE